MRLEEDEKALHHLSHKVIVQLFHGIRWQVIMRVAVKGRISDHHRVVSLIPKGGMIAESDGRHQPSFKRNEQFDHREVKVLLKCVVKVERELPGTKIPH